MIRSNGFAWFFKERNTRKNFAPVKYSPPMIRSCRILLIPTNSSGMRRRMKPPLTIVWRPKNRLYRENHRKVPSDRQELTAMK